MAKLPAGCRKLNNFCNALVRIARILPLAAKSCKLFSSSAAKDFFAVTLRQPYSKLAAGFSFSKGSAKFLKVLFSWATKPEDCNCVLTPPVSRCA